MAENRYNFYAERDNDIDSTNRVDGKPIKYLVGVSGAVVDASSDAGVVYCLDCEDVTVEGLTLRGNDYGICFQNTTRSEARDNRISENEEGIRLERSDENVVTANILRENEDVGLIVLSSSANTITNNTAKENFGDGIRLSDSANNTFAANVARYNGGGIYLNFSGKKV